MLIDTHAHLNFREFRDDARDIIDVTLKEDIWMILVGSSYKTSVRAVEYAQPYEEGVYAAVGLHPVHLENSVVSENKIEKYEFRIKAEDFQLDQYRKLAQDEKVVAIGEIGLDYYHLDPEKNISETKAKQKQAFQAQLDLACTLDLPVIIHCREAHLDMLEILKNFRKTDKSKNFRGVMHCFSGDLDLARKYFDLGLSISFTGLITFAHNWDKMICEMPLDKLLIETDCPYLTPVPHRGGRNEPRFVKYVAEKIANLRNIGLDEVAEATTRNARSLFQI